MSCCSSSSSCKASITPKKGNHYLLVGFANTGKSTLFNLLTAKNKKISKQNVGNFSGITVAAKKTPLQFNDIEAYLSDLPGLSSLTERAEQGQDLTISQQFIKQGDIDCLINVVDINQISRQLYLTTQLIELGIPMIVVLNKADKQQLSVNINKLSIELGCPVIAVSAQDKQSTKQIEKAVLSLSTAEQTLSTAEQKSTELTEKKTA